MSMNADDLARKVAGQLDDVPSLRHARKLVEEELERQREHCLEVAAAKVLAYAANLKAERKARAAKRAAGEEARGRDAEAARRRRDDPDRVPIGG